MDKTEIIVITIVALFFGLLVTIAAILMPIEIREKNAKINLYNAAAEGRASGVIIQLGEGK
jgi:hypothetical protein